MSMNMPFASGLNNHDLFNKKKISPDVLSMSSASSCSSISSRSSITNTTSTSSKSYKNKGNLDQARRIDYDNESKDNRYNKHDDEDDDDEDDDDSEEGFDMKRSFDDNRRNERSSYDKDMIKNELNEKMELLYQMERLESKGYRLPFKYNMDSNINEMRAEYNKLIKEKEIDASIRFQRKMMMAFVTGTEYLNSRYDPFAIRLEGWSEQVHENILDYDDIFEELHLKYKSTGKKMSPELRLFISLSGSAFMFHLTSRMFKENPLPEVESVLKSNPDLMKQFQAAAAKQYMTGEMNQERQSSSPMNSGLFGMVSNLFNNISGGPSQRMFEDEMPNMKPTRDIDSIINNVHNKISFDREQNNIETLSVTDEEITSIIEDTADIKILKNGKNKNSRTLNL